MLFQNRSSTCEEVKTMVQNFRDKLSRDEEIYVPYNHSLLRLDHTKMVCLGQQVNRLRREFYALVGSITRRNLTTVENYLGASSYVLL